MIGNLNPIQHPKTNILGYVFSAFSLVLYFHPEWITDRTDIPSFVPWVLFGLGLFLLLIPDAFIDFLMNLLTGLKDVVLKFANKKVDNN